MTTIGKISFSEDKTDLSFKVEKEPYFFNLLARIIRVCVFKFAVIKSFFERFLINRYQNAMVSGSLCKYMGNIDDVRVDQSAKILEDLGAKSVYIVPEDKKACVDTMLIKASTLKEKIESFGGKWEKRGSELVIVPPEKKSKDWNEFYKNTLLKMYWDEETRDGKKVLVTSKNANLHSDIDDPDKKTNCVFFSNLAISYALRRRRIAYYVGLGLDVCLYDPRGIRKSEGIASEKGIYLDTEAAASYLFDHLGYLPEKTAIVASCGATFAGTHLYRKYHDLGKRINLVFEHSPLSMQHVVNRQGWLVSLIAKNACSYIKDSDDPDHLQDGLNTLEKFETIKPVTTDDKGYAVLMYTVGDSTTPKSDVVTYGELIERSGRLKAYVLRNDPRDVAKHNEQIVDPHILYPFLNPKIQEQMLRVMFA
jgi:hypothetical protein